MIYVVHCIIYIMKDSIVEMHKYGINFDESVHIRYWQQKFNKFGSCHDREKFKLYRNKRNLED